MAITQIKIRNARHETSVIQTSFRMQMPEPVPDPDTHEYPVQLNKLEVSGNTVKIIMPPATSTIGQDAVNALVALGSRWLKTINYVQAPDGLFLITGDSCFSWIPGMTQIHNYVRDTGSQVQDTRIESYLEELGGGIHILNMCAACSSCQPFATIRMLLEDVKLKLNEFKDINLYDSATATQRKQILRQHLMAANPACNIPARQDDQTPVESSMLLGQYATCIHMWNYIAARAHSTTTISTAPHDPAGMLIKTKRIYPACLAGNPAHGTGGTIQCTIDVRRSSQSRPDLPTPDISVYVPPVYTEFQPAGFDNNVGANDATIAHDSYDASHKTITTSTWQVGAPGTYMVSAYVLPFNYAELLDAQGNQLYPTDDTRISSYTPTGVSVVDPNDGVGYAASAYGITAARLVRRTVWDTSDNKAAPAIDGSHMYNTLRAYPSTNAATINRGEVEMHVWHVRITWTLSGLRSLLQVGDSTDTPVSYVEDYRFMLPSPRLPATNLLSQQLNDDTEKPFSTTTLYNVNPRDSQ